MAGGSHLSPPCWAPARPRLLQADDMTFVTRRYMWRLEKVPTTDEEDKNQIDVGKKTQLAQAGEGSETLQGPSESTGD